MGPRQITDQCCCELLDLESMISMVENAIDASSNLPVEVDGTKQVLSYVQHQLSLTFKLVNDCLPFIQDPEVQA